MTTRCRCRSRNGGSRGEPTRRASRPGTKRGTGGGNRSLIPPFAPPRGRAVAGTGPAAFRGGAARAAGRHFGGLEPLKDPPNPDHEQVFGVLRGARRNIEVGPTQSAAARLRQPAASLLGWWRGAVLGWANGLGGAPAK